VDQVSFGVTLPEPLVGVAVKVTTPAVWACATPANNITMAAKPSKRFSIIAPERFKSLR
jgi:hypothetical protein